MRYVKAFRGTLFAFLVSVVPGKLARNENDDGNRQGGRRRKNARADRLFDRASPGPCPRVTVPRSN